MHTCHWRGEGRLKELRPIYWPPILKGSVFAIWGFPLKVQVQLKSLTISDCEA
jgi:hypothetical protein